MLDDRIKKIYLGESEVHKMYLGENLIYPREPAVDDYVMLGTTTGSTDFMIGSSTSITGSPDCIKVHVVQKPDGINTMYVKQEDVLKTPVCFFGSYNGFSTDEGKKILSIDKWNIDTSNVTRIDFMFAYCKALKTMNLKNFNASSVTIIDYMFDGCDSLESLDLSNFNTINVTSMHRTFRNCHKLTELDLRAFDTTNCYDLNMYEGYYMINKIYLSRNYFNSKTETSYGFPYMHYWTDKESLAMFVEAITANDGRGRKIYLVKETMFDGLTAEQRNAIKAKGWILDTT